MRSPVPTLVLAVLAGCPSSGDSGPSAADKCEMLLDVTCDRIIACDGGVSHRECIDIQETGLDCSEARSVDNSYDECVEQISDISCSVFIERDVNGEVIALHLPASCDGVIND